MRIEMVPTVKHINGFPACVSLSIGFNEHAVFYQTASEWLENQESASALEWAVGERDRAIATDSIWTCTWYPTTPVGSCTVAAASFETLMAAVRSANV
jgi:hypothetical protein